MPTGTPMPMPGGHADVPMGMPMGKSGLDFEANYLTPVMVWPRGKRTRNLDHTNRDNSAPSDSTTPLCSQGYRSLSGLLQHLGNAGHELHVGGSACAGSTTPSTYLVGATTDSLNAGIPLKRKRGRPRLSSTSNCENSQNAMRSSRDDNIQGSFAATRFVGCPEPVTTPQHNEAFVEIVDVTSNIPYENLGTNRTRRSRRNNFLVLLILILFFWPSDVQANKNVSSLLVLQSCYNTRY